MQLSSYSRTPTRLSDLESFRAWKTLTWRRKGRPCGISSIFLLKCNVLLTQLEGKTTTQISSLYHCIISRYFPVANLTRTRQAVIIEPLRPEKFYVKTFNATSLYILSICEVCGSYQCPYCPFYSGSQPLNLSPVIFLVFAILSLMIQPS